MLRDGHHRAIGICPHPALACTGYLRTCGWHRGHGKAGHETEPLPPRQSLLRLLLMIRTADTEFQTEHCELVRVFQTFVGVVVSRVPP